MEHLDTNSPSKLNPIQIVRTKFRFEQYPTTGDPLFLVISGPAGVGKSTLCRRLADEEIVFDTVVTATTRPPRFREVNGIDYHFMSEFAFAQSERDGDFLEHSMVHGNGPNRRYGVFNHSVFDPLKRGRNLVMNVDVKGAETLRNLGKTNQLIGRALKTVFVRTNPETSRQRLNGRQDISPEEIERRLITLEKELLEAHKFDYIIDSTTRSEDYAKLRRFIMESRPRR